MAGKPDVYQSLASFRYALRQFLAFSEAETRQAGVTPQQYQALLVIKTWPRAPATIRDLADQLMLQHNAAVQLVNRLAKAGLAERRPSMSDRRSVLLELTAKGEAMLTELASNHVKELLKHEPLLAESLSRLRRMAS
jgi:DNA-binding MarR family transcriptional regulator